MNDKNSQASPNVISTMAAEFPLRWIHGVKPYSGFMQASDPTQPYNPERAGPIMGFFFNTRPLTMDEHRQSGHLVLRRHSSTQEPVFVTGCT